MLGLILQNAVAFEIHKVVIPARLMWCDVEHKEVEHLNERKAFVELRKRFQEPRDVVEPYRKQAEARGYRSEDDDSDQPFEQHPTSAGINVDNI